MRTAIYARHSTLKAAQNNSTETQLVALRAHAAAKGWTITEEYVDAGISGSREKRPALDRMMRDARAHRFDCVLVLRFDRFARSTKHLVTALETFQGLGIDFVSLNESVDTSSPMGKMIFTVLGAVAELERAVIIERINCGLDRARKEGKTLGRPERIVSRTTVEEMRAAGKTLREISLAVNVSIGKVHSMLATVA
jgi:DNA invertase Pin-like site-specific DNA recombinase